MGSAPFSSRPPGRALVLAALDGLRHFAFLWRNKFNRTSKEVAGGLVVNVALTARKRILGSHSSDFEVLLGNGNWVWRRQILRRALQCKKVRHELNHSTGRIMPTRRIDADRVNLPLIVRPRLLTDRQPSLNVKETKYAAILKWPFERRFYPASEAKLCPHNLRQKRKYFLHRTSLQRYLAIFSLIEVAVLPTGRNIGPAELQRARHTCRSRDLDG